MSSSIPKKELINLRLMPVGFCMYRDFGKVCRYNDSNFTISTEKQTIEIERVECKKTDLLKEIKKKLQL